MDRLAASADDATIDQAMAHGRRLLATQPDLAEAQARAIIEVDARNAPALRLLGAALRAQGRVEAALSAEEQAIAAARFDPELIRAGAALAANDLPVAEHSLRQRLNQPYRASSLTSFSWISGFPPGNWTRKHEDLPSVLALR